jgi:hypothetical protein
LASIGALVSMTLLLISYKINSKKILKTLDIKCCMCIAKILEKIYIYN